MNSANLVLVQKYIHYFRDFLQGGESLLNAGKGFDLVKEKTKRGSGDIIVGVTNKKIIRLYELGSHVDFLQFAEIGKVETSLYRRTIPFSKMFKASRMETGSNTFEFLTGRRFVSEIEEILKQSGVPDNFWSRVRIGDKGCSQHPFQGQDALTSLQQQALEGPYLRPEQLVAFLAGYQVVLQEGSAGDLFKYISPRSTDHEDSAQAAEWLADQLDDSMNDHNAFGRILAISKLRGLWIPHFEERELLKLESNMVDIGESRLLACLRFDLATASFDLAEQLLNYRLLSEAKAVLKLANQLCLGAFRSFLRNPT